MARDRDGEGRARNARPRDATGRPLPRDAVGVPSVDDDTVESPAEALRAAQLALDDERPFTAHEYLEWAWRHAPADERDFWQGLAQLAVGLTHLQRGNRAGAVSLLTRGCERLSAYAGSRPHDVDVDEVRSSAARIVDRLDAGEGDEALGAESLVLLRR
jgi:hypothetical protein